MDFLDLEENSGGDSTLYTGSLFRVHCSPNDFCQDGFGWLPVAGPQRHPSAAAPQPVTLFEPPLVGSQPILSQGHDQPLYANSFNQRALAWPPIAESDENIINGEYLQGELLGIFSAAAPQPVTLFEPPPVGNQPILSQGQYANSIYQCAFAWPPVAEPNVNSESCPQDELLGIFSAAEPQPATLFEPPPVGDQPILSQGQSLYANSIYQCAFAWPPVAEPGVNSESCPQDELLGIFSAAEPQPAALFESPPVGDQPILSQGQQAQPLYANGIYEHALAWLPVAEPQENIINAENPNAELGPADPQPHHLPPPAIPVIHNNAADGSGSRPGQEFRCKNKCRGVVAGPHECSYHGRSLTISCHGDDGDCQSKFSKRNDFNRHCDTVHRSARAGAPVKRLLDCPFHGCERVGENGFKRKDNLTQHRRSVHEEKIVKNPIRFGRGNDVV